MGLTAKERAKRDDFDAQYRHGQLPAVQAVERAVCGCDYGATSWTTQGEADGVAAALELAPGVRLLEVGAGSGWPSLYLAGQSGCDVTLVDLPFEGIRAAAGRAAREGLCGACLAVVADGARLPFRGGCFDAINHSDVLCCLVRKRAVLAECRRVVRPGGRMVFSVIYIPPGLSAGDHARALETAPEFAGMNTDYPTLLAATGWATLERHDLTAAFRANCIRKLNTEDNLRAELEPLTYVADFDASQAQMRRRIAVLELRHMRREQFVVEPAGVSGGGGHDFSR